MSLKANGLTLALLASFIAPSAFAQTTATSGTNTTTATTTATTAPVASTPSPATASNPTAKLTSKFSQWAGSTENARALVEGLRSGKPITLTTATTGTSGTSSGTASGTSGTTSGSTTFTPPTKPMGYGNIKIALSLAQADLARQGITEPTPTQMQTALMGGQLTTGSGATAQTSNLQGVLQMRADGMGWGKIANTMGVKLGAVMSGKANLAPTTGTTTTASGTSTAAAKTHGNSSKGITTAGGTGAPSTGKGHAKAGSGIVTAAGGSGGGAITTGAGKGGGQVATRAVTASGGNAGGNAHAGGGNGKVK